MVAAAGCRRVARGGRFGALLSLVLLAMLASGCLFGSRSAPALKGDARSALVEGHRSEALRSLRAATERAPNDGEAFYMLGATALRMSQLDEAETALARAVDIEPRNAKWLAAYGLALRAQQRYDEAERELLRSLFLRPGDPSTLAALAEVYRLSGQSEKCAARYDQFVWFVEQGEGAVDAGQRRALESARGRARECEAAAAAAASASDAPAAPEP